MQLGNLCCFHYFRSWPNLKCLSSFHRVSLWAVRARISKTNAARNNECVIFTLVSTPPFTANLTHKSVCITIFNFQASKSHYSAAKGRAHQAPQPSISLTRSFQFAVWLCANTRFSCRANKEVTKEKKAPVFNTQMMSFSQESAVRELCINIFHKELPVVCALPRLLLFCEAIISKGTHALRERSPPCDFFGEVAQERYMRERERRKKEREKKVI
jgi:hypothetical protein